MNCIFCGNTLIENCFEHIVPESLGNKWYVLKESICKPCNNLFSQFEGKAVFNTQLGFVRTKNGIRTKSGNSSSFKIDNIKGEGHPNFKKDEMVFYGIKAEDVFDINAKSNTFKITIPDFHKSEMATAKLLLKIAYESLTKSKRFLITTYDFTDLKNYLVNNSNKDWPFITTSKRPYVFKSIPTFSDKHNLNKIKCKLLYSEVSEEVMLFEMQYDYIHLVINIISRNIDWVREYKEVDNLVGLYPLYLQNRNSK